MRHAHKRLACASNLVHAYLMAKECRTASPYCRCLYYAANALARNITRLSEEAFAPTGLAPSLAFVLMAVNREPGIQPSDIAALMMLSPSTVTRLVDKLESKGLLRRESLGKTIRVHPTATGEELFPQLQNAWQQTYQAYIRRLGEGEAQALTEAVYQAALNLEES